MVSAGPGGKPASDQGFRVCACVCGRGINSRATPPPRGREAGAGAEPWAGPSKVPPPRNVTAPRPRPRAGVSLLPSPAGAAGEPGVARWSRGPFRCAPHGRWPWGGAGALGGRLRQGVARGSASGGLPPSRFPPGPGEAAGVPGLRAAREAARAGGGRIPTRRAFRALSAGYGSGPAPFPRFPLRTLHPGGSPRV